MEDKRSKVEIYTDKDGRRRRRLVPINIKDPDQRPRSKTKRTSEPVRRAKESLPIEKKTIRRSKLLPMYAGGSLYIQKPRKILNTIPTNMGWFIKKTAVVLNRFTSGLFL